MAAEGVEVGGPLLLQVAVPEVHVGRRPGEERKGETSAPGRRGELRGRVGGTGTSGDGEERRGT